MATPGDAATPEGLAGGEDQRGSDAAAELAAAATAATAAAAALYSPASGRGSELAGELEAAKSADVKLQLREALNDKELELLELRASHAQLERSAQASHEANDALQGAVSTLTAALDTPEERGSEYNAAYQRGALSSAYKGATPAMVDALEEAAAAIARARTPARATHTLGGHSRRGLVVPTMAQRNGRPSRRSSTTSSRTSTTPPRRPRRISPSNSPIRHARLDHRDLEGAPAHRPFKPAGGWHKAGPVAEPIPERRPIRVPDLSKRGLSMETRRLFAQLKDEVKAERRARESVEEALKQERHEGAKARSLLVADRDDALGMLEELKARSHAAERKIAARLRSAEQALEAANARNAEVRSRARVPHSEPAGCEPARRRVCALSLSLSCARAHPR